MIWYWPETNMSNQDYTYPLYAKILHMGMAVFGILAFLTGEAAEDGGTAPGYLLHAYLGISLATFVLLRMLRGLVGTGPMRFAGWSPFSRHQWRLAWQDVRSLIRLKVLKRGMHEGLAGLTQAFGLAIFGWMGVSGSLLFLLGGGPESDVFERVEEAHEVGEALIPLYLALHVGSVLVHSLAGKPIWQRMWKFRVRPRRNPTEISM
jgi:cytochrome b561